MSSNGNNPRPTHEEQQSARRERLQQARLAEQRSRQVRRRAVIGVSIVAALALAGGVTLAISNADGGPGTPAAAKPAPEAPLVAPANTGGDGTVVVYGKPDAPRTLAVYEDFRCPVCQKFETANGATVQQLADAGTYKIEYHLAAFLDSNLGGRGSITALAAAGAALNQGVDEFKKFHDVLYANQPAETSDGFGDVNRILDLAGQVPGLKTEAFTEAVKNGTYLPWAEKVAAAFNNSGVTGTPTMKLDGKKLTLFDGNGPVSADNFKQQVGAA
ncbi:hypothetical protein C7C46_30935 [Streptomyces tateyamensis]|uniref:Thioredoxin-like fold domain-containing protein n=1 Tax=Streptomyces tateyamensis TaxID=565073 RepID=A0A2V4NTL6_9ACTN|nr:thioredoxin domain-containing protein [Streptomyces tateyamensis]PYC66780.1 hypothetical protein C7C46_30935 [Streptomyces tateyamensis]